MTVLHPIRRAFSMPFGLPLGIPGAAFPFVCGAAAIRLLKIRLGLYDDLSRLASEYQTDKGVTTYPFHGYTRHYHELFKGVRSKPIVILEIGLKRKRDRAGSQAMCPSLQMWADYFPHAQVLGLDLDDFSEVRLPRTKIFCGDQGNPEDLLRVVADYPRLDFVIDDGSHASFHQQVSLRTLWPYLAPGGIYIIEDLDVQPSRLEAALPPCRKTRDLLRDPSSLSQIVDGVAEVRLFDSPIRGARATMGCLIKGAAEPAV